MYQQLRAHSSIQFPGCPHGSKRTRKGRAHCKAQTDVQSEPRTTLSLVYYKFKERALQGASNRPGLIAQRAGSRTETQRKAKRDRVHAVGLCHACHKHSASDIRAGRHAGELSISPPSSPTNTPPMPARPPSLHPALSIFLAAPTDRHVSLWQRLSDRNDHPTMSS